MTAPTYGRLAAVALSATTDTTIYATASGRVAKGKVRICNRSTSASETVRLYHVNAADVSSIGTDDYGAVLVLAPSETVEFDNEVVTGGHCLGGYAVNGTATISYIGVVQDQ